MFLSYSTFLSFSLNIIFIGFNTDYPYTYKSYNDPSNDSVTLYVLWTSSMWDDASQSTNGSNFLNLALGLFKFYNSCKLLAIAAPYPKFLPFYWQTPNSNVYQYKAPNFFICESDAPRDKRPIFWDISYNKIIYTAT